MNELIAIIDDNSEILEIVENRLKKAFFDVAAFQSAIAFIEYIKTTSPDLIILDIKMPEADGLEICKLLRNNEKYADIPIIILTGKKDEKDKILGLEMGADDYITKPFYPDELAARVKAVLRRAGRYYAKPDKITIGEILEIDPYEYSVNVSGEKISLTVTEFKILELLAAREGIVFSREHILDYLWGNDKIVIDKTVDVHIKNLRKKLGTAGELIKNIRSIGYKLTSKNT